MSREAVGAASPSPPRPHPPLPRGLYVHVPYCPRRCFYCDFAALPYRPERADAFLDALALEVGLYVERASGPGGPFATLFIGGGTPTTLTPAQLDRLFRILTPLPLAGEAEVTVEANPETIDEERLAVLREAGVNRISFGLQAWDDRLLRRIGRGHTVADFRSAFDRARRAGFTNVNVDLIYGLPGQDRRGWRESLERVVALGPEHISAYSLQVEEGTPFARWQEEGRLELPDEDEVAEMLEEAIAFLERAGYERYEISNFARPGYRCRHNQIYWLNGEYLGLGPGAHSHRAGERWANHRHLGPYRRALEAGRPPIAEREVLTLRREMSDTLILGLRLREGISLPAFRARFGSPPEAVYGEALASLAARGLVRYKRSGGEERLLLTERGRALANRVFIELL